MYLDMVTGGPAETTLDDTLPVLCKVYTDYYRVNCAKDVTSDFKESAFCSKCKDQGLCHNHSPNTTCGKHQILVMPRDKCGCPAWFCKDLDSSYHSGNDNKSVITCAYQFQQEKNTTVRVCPPLENNIKCCETKKIVNIECGCQKLICIKKAESCLENSAQTSPWPSELFRFLGALVEIKYVGVLTSVIAYQLLLTISFATTHTVLHSNIP